MWKECFDRWLFQLGNKITQLFADEPGQALSQQIDLDKATLTFGLDQELDLAISDSEWIDQMVALERAAYDGHQMWSKKDIYNDMLYNPSTFYLQAFKEKELLAFVGCRRDKESIHISNLAVLPSYQSLGIGSKLLDLVKHLAPELERDSITLEVRLSNEGAKKFYLREGFKATGKMVRYYRDNHEDALTLTWQNEAHQVAQEDEANHSLPPTGGQTDSRD
ncbi:ribosomal protein S18-alanine N-acetyltransferase [Aerococcus urinae]|uniref:Ribosomal protein S18-alanine N-acetyltransferase n=1 Tax=Aerococcus mictus TaxID=2976810 RepID=A0A1E9PHT6_9LACT|nr:MULTISPECIES: ribosomal protein S18-alanine N-acetyltransferase [Aerococcus]KAA9291683.1 ribosomal-protein-alanine N-acetyltransferase [Aerococcus mictus]MBU5609565.1 ribosomal protein S18-alanine N-acetyltransferase [Aerococcus urinae]MCY3033583.1 ribosomal protein S18-alanine N-acetyltransferase [Aerococcus mictus]MCY3062872.1 ribosomal protein S18-alanine N-acetyltransferase [Aerococcus mictus]MCY3065386.1 ribosomal protein S18-alanine N-acetyltransferase [Aerococcus mictus]